MRNPSAEDTVDGIVEWWLLHEEIRFRIQEVEAALSQLSAQGLVNSVVGEDLRIRYRLNSDEAEEIRSLLERTEE